ncbi:hypothetical protein TNCV_4415831 [Trichonephila clavipes]|uniref:Uncharacterized protein n=1 Tax=Trichonephila clavipes TaxID=2585209 RepID=A0A8X6S4K5_TRICX|nr:hypothetical protein TNCV_4415831 [Trichonephila clavipes]
MAPRLWCAKGAVHITARVTNEGSFWVPSIPDDMRVPYRSRQDDRLRVMLVLVHIDITPPQLISPWHTALFM